MAGYFSGVPAVLHHSFAKLAPRRGFIKLSVEMWPCSRLNVQRSFEHLLVALLSAYETQHQNVYDTGGEIAYTQ